MRRMQIRVTEISVDLEDEELESLLERTIGPSEEPFALPATPPSPTAQAGSANGEGESGVTLAKRPAKKGRARKASAKAAAPPAAASDDRQAHVSHIIADQSHYERYYKALADHTEPGERGMIIVHLAQQYNVKGLRSTEITRILADKFSVAVGEPSIRMALMVLSKVKPPLLAPSSVKGGKAYWLTSDGQEKVGSWL